MKLRSKNAELAQAKRLYQDNLKAIDLQLTLRHRKGDARAIAELGEKRNSAWQMYIERCQRIKNNRGIPI